MIDHIAKLFAGEITIGMHRVPMLFVHVEARLYFRMFFAEFNRPFRVALYVEMGAVSNTDEEEYLVADLKNQSILAERQALCHAGFCEAMIAYFLNIQGLETSY